MSDVMKKRVEKPETMRSDDACADTFNPKSISEIEAMSISEIDNMISILRQRQYNFSFGHKSPRKYRHENFLSLFGGDFSVKDKEDKNTFGLSDSDPFATDMKNLQGDMERVGRDMWIGVLHYVRSQKERT